MKNLFLALCTLAVCGLWSCTRTSTTTRSQGQAVSVTIPVCSSKQEVVLRSTDENSISDVNIFLVQDKEVLIHKYSPSALVQFSYPAGQYQLYVIANHHADMGDLDFERLNAFSLESTENYSDLPMTAVTEIEIQATSDEQMLPPVEVQRAVAKINYSIQTAAEAKDISILSTQVLSMPKSFQPFGNSAHPAYYNGRIVENENLVSKMSGSFYLLPNLQGTVPQITTQQQKNQWTAPVNATCIRIRASRGSKILDYTVYLGENETSDFNVRPNTAHTLNIKILDDNEADVRISSFTIDVECAISAEPENGVYLKRAPITLTTTFSGKTQDAGLYCEVIVNAGDLACFTLGGIPGPVIPLRIKYLQGQNSYEILYEPEELTAQNVLLSFTVNVHDKYGLVRSYDFTYRYASKVIQVYTKWYNGGNGYGELSSPDAVNVVQESSLSAVYYLFYCSDEGCTIIPRPNQGRTFEGFYHGYGMTDFLSRDPAFKYQPAGAYDVIYAYFN